MHTDNDEIEHTNRVNIHKTVTNPSLVQLVGRSVAIVVHLNALPVPIAVALPPTVKTRAVKLRMRSIRVVPNNLRNRLLSEGVPTRQALGLLRLQTFEEALVDGVVFGRSGRWRLRWWWPLHRGWRRWRSVPGGWCLGAVTVLGRDLVREVAHAFWAWRRRRR